MLMDIETGDRTRTVEFYEDGGRACQDGWFWVQVGEDGFPSSEPYGPFPTLSGAEAHAHFQNGKGKPVPVTLPAR